MLFSKCNTFDNIRRVKPYVNPQGERNRTYTTFPQADNNKFIKSTEAATTINLNQIRNTITDFGSPNSKN